MATTTRTSIRVDDETLSLVDSYRSGYTRTDNIRHLLCTVHRYLYLGRADDSERKYFMSQDRTRPWTRVINVRIDTYIIEFFHLNGYNTTTLLKYASRQFASN